MQLTAVEARVLGSLMEKEMTTPEYYPLSLNALLAACNQKSSREPVMTLTEEDVRSALRSLEDTDLVSVDHGSRVQRYEHRVRTVFQLRRDETALLCLLLLRGPQTVGELRGRSDRLFPFDDLGAVSAALNRLSAAAEGRPDPIVAPMARQPGAKEQRFRPTLVEADTPSSHTVAGTSLERERIESVVDDGLAARVGRLEAEVATLREMVLRLT